MGIYEEPYTGNNEVVSAYLRIAKAYTKYDKEVFTVTMLMSAIGGLMKSLKVGATILWGLFSYKMFVGSIMNKIYYAEPKPKPPRASKKDTPPKASSTGEMPDDAAKNKNILQDYFRKLKVTLSPSTNFHQFGIK